MSPEDEPMPFGKYQGQTLGDIVAEDPAYLDYLRGLTINKPSLRKAIDAICEKYAGEIERAMED